MLVLGDVVATVAILIGFLAAAWGSMILAALLLPRHSQRGARRIERSPIVCLLVGLVLTLPTALVGIILMNLRNPVASLAGFLVLMGLLFAASIGSGGLARLASERVAASGGSPSEFGSMAKGAGLVTLALAMPFFGWLFLAPLSIILAIGASALALVAPVPASVEAQ